MEEEALEIDVQQVRGGGGWERAHMDEVYGQQVGIGDKVHGQSVAIGDKLHG